jgi:hypothetical protein
MNLQWPKLRGVYESTIHTVCMIRVLFLENLVDSRKRDVLRQHLGGKAVGSIIMDQHAHHCPLTGSTKDVSISFQRNEKNNK